MKDNFIRLNFLDSTRAIAALVVLVFHTNTYILEKVFNANHSEFVLGNKIHYLIGIIFNGQNAVSYFFVLSGFVISLFYFQTQKQVIIKSYVIKRVFRIFPLYLTIVLIAYITNYKEVEVVVLIKEALLIPNFHTLILPGWTMSIELFISLFIPFFIIFIYNLNQKQTIIFLTLVVLIPSVFGAFVIHFILGIWLAFKYCKNELSSLGVGNKYVLFFALVMFFLRPIIEPIKIIENNLIDLLGFVGMDIYRFYYFCSAISSFYFIAFLLKDFKLQKLLSNKMLVKLGQISYGIYLIHWLVIYYVVEEIVKKYLDFENVFAIYIAYNFVVISITIISSVFFYYFIEKPFIEFGKKNHI